MLCRDSRLDSRFTSHAVGLESRLPFTGPAERRLGLDESSDDDIEDIALEDF